MSSDDIDDVVVNDEAVVSAAAHAFAEVFRERPVAVAHNPDLAGSFFPHIKAALAAAWFEGAGRGAWFAALRGTPGARWRAEGKPDPHDARYNCERAALAGGRYTDDEVANAMFLDPSIGNLTFAKDRIRWLSRKLTEAGRPREPLDREVLRATIAAFFAHHTNVVVLVETVDGLADAILALSPAPRCAPEETKT